MTEQYKDMGKAIDNLKRPIIWIAAVGTVLHLVLLIGGIWMNRKQDELPYTTVETCYFGMKAIFGNSPDPDLTASQVIDELKGTTFKVEDITLVKMIDPYLCDVVVKDTKGFRGYAVTLEKNVNLPHLYRIVDVKGKKLVAAYQWENNL